jgi:hypothetical protein
VSHFFSRTAALVLGLIFAVILAACTPQTPNAVNQNNQGQAVAVRMLATVNLPPTPDAAEREATRRAMPVTPSAQPPTPTPTGTPYVGVFLGTPVPNSAGALVDLAGVEQQSILATPTAIEGTCTIPFDPAFGRGWESNASVARQVGCPLQERFGFAGNVQVFERGVMYRRLDTNEVWAVQPGNLDAGRYWYYNQVLPLPPLQGIGLNPPSGLRVPADIFGAVWSSSAEVNQALGYATTPEQTADLNIQRFDGGSLLLDVTVGQVFILLDDGDVFGPY